MLFVKKILIFIQVIICENNTGNQKFMDDVLTHELIHAYDVCRAKFDRKNLEHLACSSVSNQVFVCDGFNLFRSQYFTVPMFSESCIRRDEDIRI